MPSAPSPDFCQGRFFAAPEVVRWAGPIATVDRSPFARSRISRPALPPPPEFWPNETLHSREERDCKMIFALPTPTSSEVLIMDSRLVWTLTESSSCDICPMYESFVAFSLPSYAAGFVGAILPTPAGFHCSEIKFARSLGKTQAPN